VISFSVIRNVFEKGENEIRFMLMTQFINKSSQTIPIHRAGAGKNDLLL